MNESERDERLDAAWRGASREEPPPVLDVAIRAAARQAVVAAPGGRRNKHWWYPLAAAATVAVLAVGIVQLTPPERVAPAVVADRSVAADSGRQAAAVAGKPLAPPAAAPGAAAPSPTRLAPSPPGSVAALESTKPPQAVAAKVVHEPSQGQHREPARQGPSAAAGSEAAANAAAPAITPAPAAAPSGEPFPAAPMAEDRRSGYREERPPLASAPPGAAGAPPAAHAPAARAQLAGPAQEKLAAPAARSAAEWIKRIRELKTAGRLEEAAKELAAFRATYGERADALLPADLQPPAR